jgi:hypothetical protein
VDGFAIGIGTFFVERATKKLFGQRQSFWFQVEGNENPLVWGSG